MWGEPRCQEQSDEERRTPELRYARLRDSARGSQAKSSVFFLQHIHAVMLAAEFSAQLQILLLDKDAEQRSHYDKDERTPEAEEHDSRQHCVVAAGVIGRDPSIPRLAIP